MFMTIAVLARLKQTVKILQPVVFVVVNQTPGPCIELLIEFSEFLSGLVLKTDQVNIVSSRHLWN